MNEAREIREILYRTLLHVPLIRMYMAKPIKTGGH